MATGRQVREVIAETSGVPERTLVHIERRLGEAGLLPRGPRGRNAPHLKPIHVARFIIGAMSIGDSMASSAARVARQVTKIGAFVSYEIVRVAQVSGNAWKKELGIEGNPTTLIAPKGRFDRALEHILRELADPDQQHAMLVETCIKDIGIEWQRDFAVSWIAPDGNFLGSLMDEPASLEETRSIRIFFFERKHAKEHDRLMWERPASMVRTVRIDPFCLSQIAEKTLRDGSQA